MWDVWKLHYNASKTYPCLNVNFNVYSKSKIDFSMWKIKAILLNYQTKFPDYNIYIHDVQIDYGNWIKLTGNVK